MIHELIDPKKKTNKSSASKNTKTFQDAKTGFEDCSFEPSDSENKEAESSSATFIPPWLRNSLRLNQRNNLSHAAGSEQKPAKIAQRSKEQCRNDFDSLKTNIEQDCGRKVAEHFEAPPQTCPQQVNIANGADNVEALERERTIPIFWNTKRKEYETESSYSNLGSQFLEKQDSKMTNTDVFTPTEIDKVKEEDKKRVKLVKKKSRTRKHLVGDHKQSDFNKSEVDFLLEMKAREALDNLIKKEPIHCVSSEMRDFEAKILSAKSYDSNNPKLNQHELRLLQEMKNQAGNQEELESLFEPAEEINLREVLKTPNFLNRSTMLKKREDKEEKPAREIIEKCTDDRKSIGDKDSMFSTDDENDIKRFSEFLSKNKNIDEKKKCLEEVRNYFEKKRKTRLTKRRFIDEGKNKINLEGETNEEQSKEKPKFREIFRGRKSKFGLCDDEVVEKAVDETLQKFIELYHIHVSPTFMGNMKKNILQAMTSESLDSPRSRGPKPVSASKKHNSEPLAVKEPEKTETHSFIHAEPVESLNKEEMPSKEIKKQSFKTSVKSSNEKISSALECGSNVESEKIKRLKKEFNNFLHSVQTHIDVTNLKLQSILLEKEEQGTSSKSVHFVYNFAKKSLEPGKTDCWQSFKDPYAFENQRETGTQTSLETELLKRNVKVQTLEQKCANEQSSQTEEKNLISEGAQTTDEGVKFQEIKELQIHDVSPGLYRMVKSKEVGKFYLYPEQLEDGKEEVCENSNSSVVKDKKFNKKRCLLNVLSKERTKERRVFFREREKARLKKSKKTLCSVARLKSTSGQKGKSEAERKSGSSVSCLYFRDFDEKNSESLVSKKKADLTDECSAAKSEASHELGVGDEKENHLGCFWFWNGEKISPGCDLKFHVEDLLKEKLKEITCFENHQNSLGLNCPVLPKQSKVFQTNTEDGNENSLLCLDDLPNISKENQSVFTENECAEGKTIEKKTSEGEETRTDLTPLNPNKSLRNVGTQNSQHTFLSLNLSKLKIQSKMGNAIKRKFNKRNIVIKPISAKAVNMKKAENIIKAVEELKKLKFEIEKSKKNNSVDSDSLLDGCTSSSGSKNDGEEAVSVVFGLNTEEMSNLSLKNKLKKLINFADREIQTTDLCEPEESNILENDTVSNHKHLKLIESVLSRVSQKEREGLWNDVRDFLQTKISRDVNDEGPREVCIEIEQDMPRNEKGKVKRAVLAKGHYNRNDGDVEVEIDLTLEDLERILLQRQKKIRRRNLNRCCKSKRFLSSSSIQSDLTREDIRRYQEYLQRFAALREGFAQDKEVKTLLDK